MQQHNCTGAHTTTTGAHALGRTAVTNHRVSTQVNMTQTAQLRMCYATQESGGDSSDDYVALASNFTQHNFSQLKVNIAW